MADRSIKVTLRANVADFKSQIRQASSSLDDLVKNADKSATVSQTTLGRLSQSMQFQRDAWETAGTSLTAFGVATMAALTGSTKAAIDWESAFAGVKKTVDTAPVNMERLNDGLREMARTLPASHAEIAGVAEVAGQLGIQTPNILSFTETMIGLGEATSMSAEEAATTLARFVNIMGTSQGEFSNLGSAIVELGNNYATTEGDIAAMAMRLASAGRQIGMTEGDVLGMATALSSVGVEAEAGGTAISKTMISIRKAVDQGGESLELFAKTAGMSAEQFQTLFREDSGAAIAAFIQGLANVEAQGGSLINVLDELGLKDQRMIDALGRSALAADMFTEAMETGNSAFAENSALQTEVQARYETTAAQIEILKNNLMDLAIAFGEAVVPVVNWMTGPAAGLVGWLQDIPGPVKAVISGMAGLVGVGTAVTGAFMMVGPRVMDAYKAFAALSGLNLIPQMGKLGTAVGFVGTGVKKLAGIAAKGIIPVAIAKVAIEVTDALIGLNNEVLQSNVLFERLQNWNVGSIYDNMFAGFDDRVHSKFGDLAEVFDSLANVSFSDSVESFLGVSATGFNDVRSAVEQLDLVLSSMPIEQAAAEFNKLWREAGGTQEAFNNMLASMPAVKQQLIANAEAAGFAADELGAYEYMQVSTAGSTMQMAAAAMGSAEALGEVEGAAADATSELEHFLTVMAEAAGINMSADEAAMRYAETLQSVTDELIAGAGASATGTEAQRQNMASLIELSKAGWNEVDALAAQGASADTVAKKQQSLANNFVSTARQMGLSGDEAVRLAGRYGLIPSNIRTEAEFRDWQAREGINGFKRHLDGIPANKVVTLTQRIIQQGRLLNVGNTSTTGFVGSTYSSGGYTGAGGVFEPAGIVHKGEVVWSQKDVARAGGVAAVEAMRLGLRGYASGGYVSGHSARPVTVNSPSLEGLAIQGSLNINGALVPIIDGRIARNPAVSAVSDFVSNRARYSAQFGR